MGRYDKQNEKAVKRGLKWLTARRDTILMRGMCDLLRVSSAFALTLHDQTHFGHRIAADSHGWALVKDGRVEFLEVNEGSHGRGTASQQLREAASKVPNKGYVGIILASMDAVRENGRPIIFELEFEMDVMNITIDEIKSNFYEYFKPLS